jgi:hypothetical protein
MALLAALECVSLVTWFDEDTPLARIRDCQPDVLVKGGDWPVENIVGYREVRLGRQRAFHPLPPRTLDHGAAGEDPPSLSWRVGAGQHADFAARAAASSSPQAAVLRRITSRTRSMWRARCRACR